MTYEEIYSQFYSEQTDHTFFQKYSKEEAYELMRNWLHVSVAEPHIRKCFSSIVFNDEIMELSYELKNSIDEQSDKFFVKDILAKSLVINWMQKEVDNIVNIATAIGGKEEKVLLNNYKPNMDRLNKMKLELKKSIRDYGYFNNEYLGES